MARSQLQKTLDDLANGPLQPGVVVALLDGSELQLFAAGHMEAERQRPMRSDAIFRISSLGKPIVAVALLQLVEEGLVRLEDEVAQWLPELADMHVLKTIDAELDDVVPAARAITVEHLLKSTMGMGTLAMPAGATPIQREIARRGLPGFGPDHPGGSMSQDEWMRHMGDLPLLGQPGEGWFYNIATMMQGILMSRVTGRALSEQIRERITGPLGMNDTGYRVLPGQSVRLTAAYAGDMTQTDSAQGGAWAQAPAFEYSLLSTASDYAAFVRMLHNRGMGPNGPILAERLVRDMLSDHLSSAQRHSGEAFLDGRGWGYGLSVDAGSSMAQGWSGEVGWAGGLGSSWTSRLEDDAAIIILGCRAIDHPDVFPAHVELTRLALG